MQTTITAFYQGTPQPLGPQGRPSAIVKARVNGPVRITFDGLPDDQQADLKHHGGPDKAIHQFAQQDYETLAEHFPALAHKLQPGTIGETLSTETLHGDNVCIGDIWQLGTARIQVSEPRKPCWKINSRYEESGLVKVIDSQALTGWYYRVLDEGEAAAGDAMVLLERPEPQWSISRFWQLYRDADANPAELEIAHQLNGLSELWQQKITERLAKQTS